MNLDIESAILNAIKTKSVKHENGCIEWTGGQITKKSNCYFPLNQKLYNVHYHYPDNLIDNKYEICICTCGKKTPDDYWEDGGPGSKIPRVGIQYILDKMFELDELKA